MSLFVFDLENFKVLKRTYLKPRFDTIAIDRDISLVMMTDNNNPPTPPDPREASAQSSSSSEITSPTESQANPFSRE